MLADAIADKASCKRGKKLPDRNPRRGLDIWSSEDEVE
jgi:hypothetical protein